MATKINEKHANLVRKALAKSEDGLDAKGLMKATKLSQDDLKPVVNYLVNEAEEIEVDGKLMRLAEEADEAEAEDEGDEEDEEEVVTKKSSKKKGQSTKSSGKGQSNGKFSLSYATLDTLDEDELDERISTGTRAAQALSERGQKADKIVAELIMRSVGKCRKMARKLAAE